MGNTILKIEGLTKKYGNLHAVDNLNLTIHQGDIFGILGPNGSGKTTTLGMILGVINQTAGSYTWFESSPFENHRRRIGAILEHPIFYPDLTAYRNLEISCAIKEVSTDRIDIVLDRVGLIERKNSKFRTYSLGMKQRLALASALLADPDVLVLDEPTNGLDPQGINQMRTLIHGIAKEGKTIIISSHLLDEIQKTCTHVAILKQGKLLKQGEIGELMETPSAFLIKSENMAELENVLTGVSFVDQIERLNGAFKIECDAKITGDILNKEIADKGIYLSLIQKYKVSLEEEFLNIVNNEK